MAGQERQQARRSDPNVPEADAGVAPQATTQRAEALDSDLDDVLDEIDSVLEANAEEFVAGFVQKGGQ